MFEIGLEPNDVERLLKSDIEDAGKSIVRELVELAPTEMRDLMGASPSAKGSAPGIKSGSLAKSLKPFGDDSISMNHYAEFLDDSVFDGYLNRPFLMPGIDKALVKVAKQL